VKRLLLLAALGMVGCAMPQVSGRLTLPDGTTAQYASKVVEASPMNSVVVTATKVQGGESEVTVTNGQSIGASGLALGAGALAATAFLLPLCMAGNC